MKRLFLLAICFLLFPLLYTPAQGLGRETPNQPGSGTGTVSDGAAGQGSEETDSPEGTGDLEETDGPEETGGPEDAETSYIEMDIRTSTLSELAAWCRELGLSEGGSRDDLAARLRLHYGLRPRGTSQAGQRIITIESAKTTEYFTLEVVDEEYARLKGDVIISLKDGGAIHRIKAWEILYNRTRNVMTATGNVEYVKEEGNTIETFRGHSITVNLDNWSSIFMDGSSEKAVTGKSSAYRFAGTVISRSDEEVTVLTKATVTNPANEEAYWSLHASKLWLLPGNDWAILNAVLKVGEIPLLYLPFFFYPADEIVFHPVLGFRSREGTFLQTTTYILGRPKSAGTSENSLTRIFGGDSENTAKVREGVFLRTTKEKRVDPSNKQLSVIFDAYVNLGFYLGTELSLPVTTLFGETKLSAGLGLTRNIYQVGSDYNPFPNYDGESEWNSGRLISFDIPFRYRFKLTGSLNKITNGSLSWEIPYYSDPYVDRDFMRRTEVLDWLSMLREGASSSDVADDTSLSSYEWKLTGAFNPSVVRFDPYISSFTISNLSSSLLFNERSTSGYSGPTAPPNPGRTFFYPDRFTFYSVTAALSGTPFKTDNSYGSKGETVTGPAPGDELLPDLPISPWGESVEELNETQDGYAGDFSGVYNFAPPVLNQRFSLSDTSGVQLSLDYRLAPTSATELQFRSTAWNRPEDINWGEVASIHSSVRSDGSVGLNLDHSVYSGALRLSATGSWQDYMFLNEGAEEYSSASAVKAARDRVNRETYLTSSWDFSSTVKPFFQDAVWGNSNLQYGLRGLLVKTTVDTDGSDPVWDWVFGSWDKTDIENHQVSANLAARVMDYSQNFSVSAVLPPKDSSVTANATFRAWITETALRSRVLFPLDEDLRVIEPFSFTETLRFSSFGSFQQYIVFDPEISEYTTFTSTLSLSSFLASYSAVYTQPYRYNYNGSVDNNLANGWIQMNDKGFYPYEFKLGFNKTFTQDNLWGKRLSFSIAVNSNLAFDLQRYTNSKFTFGLGVKLAITNFLVLDFSTNSENAVVFKYFQGLPFFDLPAPLYEGQETNFFVDLFNSFRFDNEDLRRQSGFKMKTLNMSLIHHLGDWNAKLTMTMTPYLPQGSREYRFDNEIAFLIQWVPIGEIKTQIDYVKEALTVK